MNKIVAINSCPTRLKFAQENCWIFNSIRNRWAAANFNFFLLWRCDPAQVMASSFTRFLDYTQQCITAGRTPLDEWSARRRDYLTTHNTHNRQTLMPPVGFEATISAGERPQTYALDRAATETGFHKH